MNKKVSTILTCGLILGGSLLCSSAFAETIKLAKEPATKIEANKQYAIVQDFGTNGKWVYAFSEADKTTGKFYDVVTKAAEEEEYLTIETGDESVEGFMWNVAKASGSEEAADPKFTYKFTNVGTQTVLSVDQATKAIIETTKPDATVKTWSEFTWESWKAYDGTARRLYLAADANYGLLLYSDGSAEIVDTATETTDWSSLKSTTLYEVLEKDDVTDGELNTLFNTKGFNFDVKKANDKIEALEGNLFGGNSRVWAFEVNEDACAATNWDDEKGFKVSEKNANGEDLYIPEGIYFFADRVMSDTYDSSTNKIKAEDIDWLASTLIAVSPRETVETTVPDRANGQGFKLVEVQGSEFIFVENTSEMAVGDMPINNACFSVYDNYGANENYPYALELKEFYYQEKSTDAATAKAVSAKVQLGVLAFDSEATQWLTTISKTTTEHQYVFRFGNSAAVDGIDLLKTTKEAAVYTIKFVAGNEEDEELVGKYLTVGVDTNDDEVATGSDFHWVAKGSMISDPTYPSFQYTITAVDKETGKLVTFTNRETNKSFTAQLFPEEGTNRYSIACVTSEGEPMDLDVMPLDVNTTLYTVEKAENADVTIDEDVIIELTPVTPDEYAGFYNVDSESVRTIRFARDKNDTSYKWYAGVAVNANGNVLTNLKDGKGHDYFVEDVYEAAQWQLIKAEKPNTIARTFVYNNTTTESVDNVVNGDKVSAYQYVLRYVQDGTPSKYYLTDGGDIALVDAETAFKAYDKKKDFDELTSAQKFYIKENADGSVSLFGPKYSFGADNTDQKIVTKATKNVSIDASVTQTNGTISYVNKVNNREYRSAVYAYTSSADNLKVYLDGEAPNFSWTEEGHVTMQNGTSSVTGNYVSMNAANEGVLLNSEEGDVFYLHMTDNKSVVPSFYISLGQGEGSDALSERLFLYNPVDSVSYPVDRPYDANYQLSKNDTKAIFKAGSLDASRDTMTTSIKGEEREIAVYADNESTWGGLNRFKFQIIESANEDGLYNIRQIAGGIENGQPTSKTVYLASSGEKLYFTTEKDYALALGIKGVEAPTANEAISATDVKVVAYDGSINIKNAAGKNVVVSTILGQIVANEVLTSDNATISVPAGIAIVSVDGEEAVKVSVR